jgi:hypothetical protein
MSHSHIQVAKLVVGRKLSIDVIISSSSWKSRIEKAQPFFLLLYSF